MGSRTIAHRLYVMDTEALDFVLGTDFFVQHSQIRTSGRGWESARPRTPHHQARGAPPKRPRVAPTARKASSQERAL